MDPALSSRVAFALHGVSLDFPARQEIARQVDQARRFEDLPATVRSLIEKAEADVGPDAEWRKTGRWQLTRADLKTMSSAGIEAARQQGRLQLLLGGKHPGSLPPGV